MSTYVIVNRQGEFYQLGCKWKKEFPDAYVMTDKQEALDIHKTLTPLMTKVVQDYGTENETSDI